MNFSLINKEGFLNSILAFEFGIRRHQITAEASPNMNESPIFRQNKFLLTIGASVDQLYFIKKP